jgi:hypothetical protein
MAGVAVNLRAMRLGFGGVFAKCSACQGEDFYPAFPFTPDRREVMVCVHCENQALYGDLVAKSRQSSELAQKDKWTPTPTPTKKTPSRRRSR